MKRFFLLLLAFLMFFSGPYLYADHGYNNGYYSSGDYGQSYQFRFCPDCNRYHSRNHPHFREGAGKHVPTGSVASPYQHGVHHGTHYSQEEGWHSGSHYGHE